MPRVPSKLWPLAFVEKHEFSQREGASFITHNRVTVFLVKDANDRLAFEKALVLSEKSLRGILKLSAAQLCIALEHYQRHEPIAIILLQKLDNLIGRAVKKEITAPMGARDIPGYRYFTETLLGGYRDREEAFASFYVELIGGHSSKAFQMRQGKIKQS